MNKQEKTLSDKIEKEGNTTWGFREGFLDVEDVKQFIKEIIEMKGIEIKESIKEIIEMKGIEHDGSFISCANIRDFIKQKAGEELL